MNAPFETSAEMAPQGRQVSAGGKVKARLAQPRGRSRSRRFGWNSLRLRILAAVLLWTGLGIAGIWYSATRLFAKHVEAQYHDELQVHVKELARLVEIGPGGTLRMDRPLSDPRFLEPMSGFYWQVSATGQETLRSPSMTRGHLDPSVAHASTIRHLVENGPSGPTITYGMLREGPSGEPVHFVIATDVRLLDEIIASFTRELTVWLTLLALALLSTGLVAVSFGMRPLDRLAVATARLRSGRAARLEGRYPEEIAPLVEDLNVFIEHNRKVVEEARVEAGNLAHALRTPLSVITDEAERLALDPRTEATAKVLLSQSGTMVQQVEYRLARARAAASGAGPGAFSTPGEVLGPVLSALQRLHRERHFVFDAGGCEEAILRIDPVDLSELLSILLDNAAKWSREEVRVMLARDAGSLTVRIRDDGPGLTREQIGQAFEVGTRFDAQTPGFGLGLAIARDIALANGVGLELAPVAGEGEGTPAGLDALVSIPLARADEQG